MGSKLKLSVVSLILGIVSFLQLMGVEKAVLAIVFGTFEHADRVPGSPGAKAETGKVDKGRGRANISPNEDDPDDFPDATERQKRSRRGYCC